MILAYLKGIDLGEPTGQKVYSLIVYSA